ncbi:aspartate--tRNA ligase [Entomospira nematocerorum]|uniref:Aspartate--tRNA ligase n=1 Tax=Entomospira nematocerorum TaxID=2719987 RepID=A0A968GEW9_9SPIO|nr:aspartate--tRNA ligase [Entomospira nematocera]NIZ46948.1 aspartate--tRNA ligase [Entomospira nematocera]WDI34506.1 aspartate--tRNA ligase [Entomospira nematocera]
MQFSQRTHSVAQLNKTLAGSVVTLNGWVHRLRNQGTLIFINIRDRSGVAQCLINDQSSDALKSLAKTLHNEYCISITGTVQARPSDMVNHEMSAGDIEIIITDIEILNTCLTPPFIISDDNTPAKEDLRLKYRYLDMRSGRMQRNLYIRHQVALTVRKTLDAMNFYEIETPLLIKSTPEGARDYVVPSRIYPNQFFALPQSPQIYKQILMVGGYDRYFQIARCFRDEDPRGDRQPEFTQIDIEMSFVQRNDILQMAEHLFSTIMKEVLNVIIESPFPRFSYHEAMNRFGSDKPDIRYQLELEDATTLINHSDAIFLKESLSMPSNTAKMLRIPHYGATMTRKVAGELENMAKRQGLSGLAWFKVSEQGIEGGASKFFQPHLERINESYHFHSGDVILIAVGNWTKVCNTLGLIRQHIAKELNLIDQTQFAFCWVVDFPLFEFDEDTQMWQPMHHMFSSPQERFIPTLEEHPGEVLGDLYDLVLNGYELASGSIRIHNRQLQERIFNLIGYSKEDAQERFGFMLDAFEYGAPPHGGIAAGLDRLVMIMCQEETIREVIAYPKNTAGFAPMEEAPAFIENEQLQELHLDLQKPVK